MHTPKSLHPMELTIAFGIMAIVLLVSSTFNACSGLESVSSCDALAGIVSESVKLLCQGSSAAQQDTSYALGNSPTFYTRVIAGDTVSFHIAINRFGEYSVSWESLKGKKGKLAIQESHTYPALE